MAVSYLSLGALSSPESVDGNTAILVDPRMEQGAASLGERLRESMRTYAPAAWVVRGSTRDHRELLETDAILPELSATLDVPIFGLSGSHDVEQRQPQLWQPSWAVEGDPVGVEDLREAELLGILERTNSISRLARFHYILPSRYHAEEFIRLADALQDPIDTIRIVDWLLPYLRPGSWAISDTGTILALLFALRAEARDRFGFALNIANLSEYPSDYVAMDELLRSLHADHTLLIVSVSSSGRVADQFERLCPGEHDVIVLCETGKNGARALSRHRIDRWPADEHGKCARCDALNQLVVDPRTYQVLPSEGLRTVKFDFDKAAEQEEFWRLADRTEAVKLHFDEQVPAGPRIGRRHTSIDIDIPALLSDDDFRRRVVEELQTCPLPDAVLVPDHGAATAISALATEAFSHIDDGRVHRVRGSKLDTDLISELLGKDRVLLLDDAVVTGNTLVALRREIYEKAVKRGRPPTVEAFVVLDRLATDDDESAVRRPFTKKGEQGEPLQGFRAIERIRMPPFHRCPWCEEAKRLRQLISRTPEHREFVEERLSLLSSMTGLRPPLLPTQEDRPEQFTHDSFIGDLRPAAAFAATAAAAHGLTLKLEKLRKGAEVGHVDVEVVAEAFFDQIIVAGILRIVPQRFLRNYSKDAAVNHMLASHAEAFGENCLAELAWAAVQELIPREAIHARLVEIEQPSPALAYFQELLEAQDPTLSPTSAFGSSAPVEVDNHAASGAVHK